VTRRAWHFESLRAAEWNSAMEQIENLRYANSRLRGAGALVTYEQ
jgi:hypothetical protein